MSEPIDRLATLILDHPGVAFLVLYASIPLALYAALVAATWWCP